MQPFAKDAARTENGKAYPLIYWLELLMDFVCLEKGAFDVAYMTELDPLWNDDELSFILNPEAGLFRLFPRPLVLVWGMPGLAVSFYRNSLGSQQRYRHPFF